MRALVNQVETKITNVKKSSTGMIDYIIFECKKDSCKGKKEATIEIRGFRNPGYKMFNTSTVPVVQFGELVQRPERLYSSNSTILD